jgi:hypothetical protein
MFQAGRLVRDSSPFPSSPHTEIGQAFGILRRWRQVDCYTAIQLVAASSHSPNEYPSRADAYKLNAFGGTLFVIIPYRYQKIL